MLDVKAISAGYGAATVLHEASLTLGEGEIVALIGANGAGKSTLVNAVSGLLPLRGGTVTLAGERIDRLAPGARVRHGLVHVPEGRQVFGALTVDENLMLGCYAQDFAPAKIRSQRDVVCAFFPPLQPLLSTLAANLSGGQQQMLAIARGLMSAPRFLLLDEPSLGLSPSLVAAIFEMIVTLGASGMSILLSEQNAQQSLAIAHRGYVLESGRIVMSGDASALMRSPEIAERYLGVGAGVGTDGERQRTLATRLGAALAL